MNKKAKRPSRPIYMIVRKLVDPDTGEVMGALVPSSDIDRRLMKEKRLRVGAEVRAEIKNPRNSRFHRLVHVLGGMMVDHVEAFQGLTFHAAIKRLQRESGICCEEQEIDVPGFGKLVVKVALSLSYDDMDESEFKHLFSGICRYVTEKYWPDLTEEQIAEQAELMPEAA